MKFIYSQGRRNYGPFNTRQEAKEWGESFGGKTPDDSRVTAAKPYTFELPSRGGWFVEFGA